MGYAATGRFAGAVIGRVGFTQRRDEKEDGVHAEARRRGELRSAQPYPSITSATGDARRWKRAFGQERNPSAPPRLRASA